MRVSMLIPLALIALLASVAPAEVVHLNDGTSITGDIKRSGDGWDVFDAKGKKVAHIAAEQVRSIELTPKGDPKDQALVRLLSLRRSVEALNDLKVIIDRFEKFIEQNKGTPAEAQARNDLALWKERLDKGMMKVGARWILPEERGVIQVKSLAAADEARHLIKQSRLKEAEPLLARALADDPGNVAAQYLRGLLLFKQDKIPDARKAFEAVKEVSPDHGPTLNNLAVIQWRQNQHMGALTLYLATMQALPLNREVLNNVAEALNALPEKERKHQIAQKTFKTWTQQDTQLQQQLAQEGLYRWGATWVDKAQFEKLQAAEKEVKDKIEKLEKEFADAQAKISEIEGRIQANNDAMAYIERTRYGYDASGRLIVYPLPAQYYDYDRANRQLEVQRRETGALMDALRAKGQAVKAQLPVPKFTGIQSIAGVEGTPALAPSVDRTPTPVAPANPATPATPATPANLMDELGGAGAGGATKPVNPPPVDPPNPDPTTKPTPPKDRPLKY